MKKKAVYVLMVSKTFPAYHPRKGEDTFFKEKILQNFPGNPQVVLLSPGSNIIGTKNTPDIYLDNKITTIRENYDLWARRAEKINKGEAVLSLRQWSGKPYNSKQKEFMRLEKIGVQPVILHNSGVVFKKSNGYKSFLWNEGPAKELVKNDGLSFTDFYDLFCPPLKDISRARLLKFNGCILHFTDFRY